MTGNYTTKAIFLAVLLMIGAALVGIGFAGGIKTEVEVENAGAKGSAVQTCNEGEVDYVQLGSSDNKQCGEDPAPPPADDPAPVPDATPNDSETTVIEGQITGVTRDSQPDLTLIDDAKYEESSGPPIADRGYSITLDGKAIQVASGFVPADQAFNKQVDGMLPGAVAKATAVSSGSSFSLNCDDCKLEIITPTTASCVLEGGGDCVSLSASGGGSPEAGVCVVEAISPCNAGDIGLTDLVAIDGSSSSGAAARQLSGSLFKHTVSADLPAPTADKFYEGWIVGSSVVSTGELKQVGDRWELAFSGQQALFNNLDKVVITLETKASGLDGNPETHILEGSF